MSTAPIEASRFERATFCRKLFSVVKYRAEPSPVLRAEGRVPRQKDRIEVDDLEISRIVSSSGLRPDCCTRVFRRSAGWRRTADRTPDPSPATKWNARQSISVMFYYAEEVLTRRRFAGLAAI